MIGEGAAQEMRMSEFRADIAEARRRNCQLLKEITLLKAIVQELQDDS